MQIKPGVIIQGVRPELLVAIQVADVVYTQAGHELLITSLLDGQHSRNSLHYTGCAVDIGVRGLDAAEINDIVLALKKRLTRDFDVIVESTHIHIEYQPRGQQ